MTLWFILVTLPISFFRILRYVLPTSIWTRFMKNRIAQTEPNPNEEICDLDIVEGFCGNGKCDTSIITDRPQSGLPNLSSGTSEEKSNEDELYSESSIDKQNASVFVEQKIELISDDPMCVLVNQTLTTSLAEKAFTMRYKMSSSILAKQNVFIYSLTDDESSGSVSSDEITKESGDDVTYEKFDEESSDKFTDEELGYKISDEYADKITNVRFIEESGDKIAGEASGDEITGEASGDEITGEASGGEITGEASGGEITGEASGGDIIGEASGGDITDEASGDGITGDATGDGITDRKFEGQTTDTMGKNDNGESNNISDHECYDAKNFIHEECSHTLKLTILPEKSSEIDDCQPTFKRYFDHHNIMFLSDLYIPEDPFTEMYEDFLLSPTNEMAPSEFPHKMNDNISAITRKSSDDFTLNELKPDVCDVNELYKCSLDIIPMEFIYPCLPHSMNF